MISWSKARSTASIIGFVEGRAPPRRGCLPVRRNASNARRGPAGSSRRTWYSSLVRPFAVSTAKVVDEAFPVVEAEHGVGIADVDDEEHLPGPQRQGELQEGLRKSWASETPGIGRVRRRAAPSGPRFAAESARVALEAGRRRPDRTEDGGLRLTDPQGLDRKRPLDARRLGRIACRTLEPGVVVAQGFGIPRSVGASRLARYGPRVGIRGGTARRAAGGAACAAAAVVPEAVRIRSRASAACAPYALPAASRGPFSSSDRSLSSRSLMRPSCLEHANDGRQVRPVFVPTPHRLGDLEVDHDELRVTGRDTGHLALRDLGEHAAEERGCAELVFVELRLVAKGDDECRAPSLERSGCPQPNIAR